MSDSPERPTPARRERRRGQEPRIGGDRRELIRYEPRRALRREGGDRRRHSGWDDLLLR